VKSALFLLNVVFAMKILDLIFVFTYILLPVLLYSVFKINALLFDYHAPIDSDILMIALL